jgi:predicted nucleic acid-binding protein
MATTVIIDTNVLVALVDARDNWHPRAIALRDALLDASAPLVYFDCVVNEAIGVIGRRAEEQKRSDQFESLLDGLTTLVPEENLTWISAATQRLFQKAVSMCRSHQGRFNFHDALMALACQELDIQFIASFDPDFDGVGWLTRIADPEGTQLLRQSVDSHQPE